MIARTSNHSAKCAVEYIANASRAIVAVVVVVIEAVFGPLIPLDELQERRALRWGEVELLRPDRAVCLAVLIDGRLKIEAPHPIKHVAPEKTREKILGIEIEQSPVVGDVGV